MESKLGFIVVVVVVFLVFFFFSFIFFCQTMYMNVLERETER